MDRRDWNKSYDFMKEPRPGISLSWRKQHPHSSIKRLWGSAELYLCEGCCGSQASEWAWVHGTDRFDIRCYIPMCAKCHRPYDRRGSELFENTRTKPRPVSARNVAYEFKPDPNFEQTVA